TVGQPWRCSRRSERRGAGPAPLAPESGPVRLVRGPAHRKPTARPPGAIGRAPLLFGARPQWGGPPGPRTAPLWPYGARGPCRRPARAPPAPETVGGPRTRRTGARGFRPPGPHWAGRPYRK